MRAKIHWPTFCDKILVETYSMRGFEAWKSNHFQSHYLVASWKPEYLPDWLLTMAGERVDE